MRLLEVLLAVSLLALTDAALPLKLPPRGVASVNNPKVVTCGSEYDYTGTTCSVTCGEGVRAGRLVVFGSAVVNGTCGSAPPTQTMKCNMKACEEAEEGLRASDATVSTAVVKFELPAQWNQRLKALTANLVSKIPYVGQFLSFLVNIFWPSKEPSIWDQIKDQVQQVVDTAILNYELQERQAELRGLERTLKQYVEVKIGEKGGLLASMVNDCNTIFEKLTGSSNAKHLLPVTVAMAHLHLGILRERFTHGIELYGENSTEVWLRELSEQYQEYRDHFEKIYPAWWQWRRDQITAKSYLEEHHTHYDTWWYACGETKDALTGESVFFKTTSWVSKKDDHHFEALTAQCKVRMERQAKAALINNTMIPSFLISVYVPVAPVYVDPTLETFTLGPFSSTTMGLGSGGDWTTTTDDPPGKVTGINLGTGDWVDFIQFDYSDHRGQAAGNTAGGRVHHLTPPEGQPVTGLNMGFGNTSLLLKSVQAVMGNVSTAWLGNDKAELVKVASAVMDPEYQLDGWSWRSSNKVISNKGILVVELSFRHSSKFLQSSGAEPLRESQPTLRSPVLIQS